jgi:hypothetical protein
MSYFLKVVELSPPSHGAAACSRETPGEPAMLTSSGFRCRERGAVSVVNERPDVDIAVRALAAAGPSAPAIEAVGLAAFCAALRDVIEPMHVRGIGIRVASELGCITADCNPR